MSGDAQCWSDALSYLVVSFVFPCLSEVGRLELRSQLPEAQKVLVALLVPSPPLPLTSLQTECNLL